jgi:BMFP domain-containing protein YqiC
LNVEENINTTYKHFKQLQEDWKNAGPIPRDKYNNVWNNYHHHVERFYDFLHLNRDLRDLDFKHNLDQKLKLIDRAEELSKDDNSNRAFRELQALHKIWKEELGPVERERREEIWERFSAATKLIHEKRQLYFKEVDKVYEKNLELKCDIINQIDAITSNDSNNHSAWQKKIKQIENLRSSFFNAGKVPIKVNEETWAKFKESVRAFNRKKNSFYKSLKKDQYQNLQKKLELIKIAEENKSNSDFSVTTPLMKKIQNDWKEIGHVPRRESDKIWNQFKTACNFYFDKLNESKNTVNKEELEALEKKIDLLEKTKKIKITDDKTANIQQINDHINTWKAIGHVPYNKRAINKKFNTVIESIFNKLDISKNESELLKYNHKIANLSSDKRSLDNEHNFIRKKIDEVKGEINQLENNLQFFSNVKDDNPLVKDVHKNIKKHKDALELWKEKLKQIKQFY